MRRSERRRCAGPDAGSTRVLRDYEPLQDYVVLMLDGEPIRLPGWQISGGDPAGAAECVEALRDYRRGQAHAESALLDRCARCEYRLRGLPVEHRCPECGLMLDRRWRIIAPRPLLRAYSWAALTVTVLQMAMACIFLYLGIWGLLGAGPLGSLRAPIRLLLAFPPILIGGAIVMFNASRLWAWTARPRVILAAGREGLLICWGGDEFEAYAWNRIGEAVCDRPRLLVGAGAAVVVIDGQARRIPARWFSRGDLFQPGACVEAINRFRVRP